MCITLNSVIRYFTCLHVFSSVWWCPRKNNFSFVSTPFVLFMLLVCLYINWCLTWFTYHMLFLSFNSNTMGVTYESWTTNPSGAPKFTLNFKLASCCSIFSFLCDVCRSFFVLSSFFFLASCLSFDIRIRITPLVSSNSSCVCQAPMYNFWLPVWYLQTFLVTIL